jgi:hypothetical protein
MGLAPPPGPGPGGPPQLGMGHMPPGSDWLQPPGFGPPQPQPPGFPPFAGPGALPPQQQPQVQQLLQQRQQQQQEEKAAALLRMAAPGLGPANPGTSLLPPDLMAAMGGPGAAALPRGLDGMLPRGGPLGPGLSGPGQASFLSYFPQVQQQPQPQGMPAQQAQRGQQAQHPQLPGEMLGPMQVWLAMSFPLQYPCPCVFFFFISSTTKGETCGCCSHVPRLSG